MQQSDTGSSYYQYYQSHIQNPNPNDLPQLNPFPSSSSTFASAPPVSSSDYSSSNSSTYPPYSQYTTDHALNPPLLYPPNPNSQSPNLSSQPYNFPHLNPQPTQQYYGYDQNQEAFNYDNLNPTHNSNPNSTSYSSAVSNYENLYESGSNYGLYGDVGKQRPEVGSRYGDGGDGVYAYNGSKVVPYGGGGSGSDSSSGVIFDDYGRPVGFANGKEQNGSRHTGKVVKAIPKTEMQQDGGSGVQKFRVKILSEGAGQSDMDVLCQIGLDGIRILDTATSRTLRIYPLETVTRCEVLDSYIFAFWAKSSIDIELRRVRLKSNSYTTNNILDTVTAATFQVGDLILLFQFEIKEMAGRNKPSDTPKASEQLSDKKKGFADWMNLMKPSNEEKDHWVPDEAVTKCTSCRTDFGAFVRRHHCRNCGDIFCDKCTQGRIALTEDEHAIPVRVCDRCMTVGEGNGIKRKEIVRQPLQPQPNANNLLPQKLSSVNPNFRPSTITFCGSLYLVNSFTSSPVSSLPIHHDPHSTVAEVTQRLGNAKETSGKIAALQSHEDLAKRLKEYHGLRFVFVELKQLLYNLLLLFSCCWGLQGKLMSVAKEEMDKNRMTTTGLTSNGSGMRMKEVACPTCTVHLQVRVPASGSETIECSVCQHPFLVSAN
ncbi:hypothetical protein TEA_017025 [Camellia sinensis var. sinensis]|uniref:FYVE-type domain-containing protein n=1 Tax=Camellia sinensis var. sinensis TaxID=542762 RepID=A0A4S4DJ06_CAMSN|nr:hypothetical protein TEA_017025 [Camellia sinensis var. sinensis]